MNKFYGDNINAISPEYLLEATPFSTESRINFSKELTPQEFFNKIYVEPQAGKAEIAAFDARLADALRDSENIFAKVDLIHIAGYAGCGKTTFVRHLIWTKFGEAALNENVIDCEGLSDIPELLRSLLAKKVCYDTENGGKNLKLLQQVDRFHLAVFGPDSAKALHDLFQMLNRQEDALTEDSVKDILRAQKDKEYFQPENRQERYLYYLLTVYFIWEFSAHASHNLQRPIIILFDNVDSLRDISQERAFVYTLKQFINSCNYFFGFNADNSEVYGVEKISSLVKKTKFLCFLTTRLITATKYQNLDPDLENAYGWVSLHMPEEYYSHIDIIQRRVTYYKELEQNDTLASIQRLESISEFSHNIYKNDNFRRLFNGNLRYCINTICQLIHHYECTSLIDESNALYRLSLLQTPISKEVKEGSSGILLSMLLQYLKQENVYAEKFHLSECQPDGKLSLSRIILTILREKGNFCYLPDLLDLLNPLYSVKEVCETVFDLSEAKRNILRRMLTCDVTPFVSDKEEFLERVACYEAGAKDPGLQYAELRLCLSGETYLNYVVPHFEFMLSRHKGDYIFLTNFNYHPLFSAGSEQLIGDSTAEQMYAFERKIDWVYGDVKDCCKNSTDFSKQVMEALHLTKEQYLNNSYFNYSTAGRDGSPGYRQSYESRLIFSHIGYIERYRRYLLDKHRANPKADLQSMNQRLILRIERYLTLYQDEELCFHTAPQDSAAAHLQKMINAIRQSEYKDFTTKIEISY